MILLYSIIIKLLLKFVYNFDLISLIKAIIYYYYSGDPSLTFLFNIDFFLSFFFLIPVVVEIV